MAIEGSLYYGTCSVSRFCDHVRIIAPHLTPEERFEVVVRMARFIRAHGLKIKPGASYETKYNIWDWRQLFTWFKTHSTPPRRQDDREKGEEAGIRRIGVRACREMAIRIANHLKVAKDVFPVV